MYSSAQFCCTCTLTSPTLCTHSVHLLFPQLYLYGTIYLKKPLLLTQFSHLNHWFILSLGGIAKPLIENNPGLSLHVFNRLGTSRAHTGGKLIATLCALGKFRTVQFRSAPGASMHRRFVERGYPVAWFPGSSAHARTKIGRGLGTIEANRLAIDIYLWASYPM